MTGTATGLDGSAHAQTARERFWRRFFGRDHRWRYRGVIAVFFALIAVFTWAWPSEGLRWLAYGLGVCFVAEVLGATLHDS